MGFFGFLRDVHERHERLKHRVHSFRLPLSPGGRRFMTLVYFSLPIFLGYNIMQFTNKQAEANIGAKVATFAFAFASAFCIGC
jgi:hypothetical protein